MAQAEMYHWDRCYRRSFRWLFDWNVTCVLFLYADAEKTGSRRVSPVAFWA